LFNWLLFLVLRTSKWTKRTIIAKTFVLFILARPRPHPFRLRAREQAYPLPPPGCSVFYVLELFFLPFPHLSFFGPFCPFSDRPSIKYLKKGTHPTPPSRFPCPPLLFTCESPARCSFPLFSPVHPLFFLTDFCVHPPCESSRPYCRCTPGFATYVET